MRELIFNDGRKLEVQRVITNSKMFYVRVILTTSEQLKALFADEFATSVMRLVENRREVCRYENYIALEYIKEETGGIWEVALQQKEANTEDRLAALEKSREEQEKEIETIKESMESGGTVDNTLFQASIVVARANAQMLSDQDAIEAKAIYHTWHELVGMGYSAEKEGYKFTHEDLLYKTLKAGQKFESQGGFQDRVQNLCLYGLMKLTPEQKKFGTLDTRTCSRRKESITKKRNCLQSA